MCLSAEYCQLVVQQGGPAQALIDLLHALNPHLQGAASSLPGEMAQEIEHVVGLAVQARPQLQQQPLSPQPPLTITPEIEAQANKLYQDVYDDRMTVEAFIAMLKTCQVGCTVVLSRGQQLHGRAY